MVATLSRRLIAALLVSGTLAAGCSASDPYDEPTRVSVFEDLAATLERALAVPTGYRGVALAADDPARADRDRARQLIGNGLGTTDLRRVSRDGVAVAVLQATVFSALAPAGSVESLVAGYIAGNAPSRLAVGDQSVLKIDGAYVWARGRTVVTFSGTDEAALRDLVESYVKGRIGGS